MLSSRNSSFTPVRLLKARSGNHKFSALLLAGILIGLGCTTAQSFAILGDYADLRAHLFRSPLLIPFTRSSTATYRDAIVAYDTYVAGWRYDICCCASFAVLVLTDFGICTAWKVTEIHSALRTWAAFHTGRTVKLTVGQRSYYASFSVLVLTDLSVRTSWKVTEIHGALRAGAAFHAGRAVELPAGQRSCCTSLRSSVLAERGIHTSRKVTESGSAHGTRTAFETWRALELTADDMRLRTLLVAVREKWRRQDSCGLN